MMLRVAVAGAAGRMGQAVVAAVEGADDLELTGQADPALGVALAMPSSTYSPQLNVDTRTVLPSFSIRGSAER